MTIVEFIEQRLSEDEAEAERYMRGFPIPGRGDSSAAQALRRCAMIRAIMRHAAKARQLDEEIEQGTKSSGAATSPAEPWIDEQIHRDIAAYWNTHPDYRKEWANG